MRLTRIAALCFALFAPFARAEECGEDARLFQVGEASWYGPGFHGKRTANGERYDMYELTVAHRKLISLVKRTGPVFVCVLNPKNGKTIRARVNDSGPYYGERIIDLSYAAARDLGLDQKGIGQVQIYLYD
jgi:rare lipoprotein A